MSTKENLQAGLAWEKPTMTVVATATEICSGDFSVDEDFTGTPS